MKRTYLGLIALSLIAFASCGKKTGGCFKGEKAWVEDYTQSDSYTIVFKLEDGKKIEAINLSEYSQMNFQQGDLLWLSYKPASGASTCGLGEVVELKCVAEREY